MAQGTIGTDGPGRESVLFTVARRATRRSLRILCYHGLWTAPGAPHGECLFMAEQQFAARMRWLAASRYPVLPLDEAVDRLQAGTLPACAVVITIDDGWLSTATHMAPMLHELRLPATLYVSTWYVEHQAIVVNVVVNFVIDRAQGRWLDLSDVIPGMPHPLLLGDKPARAALALRINQAIDAVPTLATRVALAHRVATRAGIALEPFDQQFRFMTPEQLRHVHALGIAIELHGHRHQSVDASGADLTRELADNRAAIARAGVTAAARHFCYPKGDLMPGIDAQLARHGVLSATTTRRGLNPPGTPVHRLARLLDGPRISQRSFEAWLAGLYQPYDRFRRQWLEPTAQQGFV